MQLMEITSKDIQNAENLLAVMQKGTYEVKGDSISLLSSVIAQHESMIARMKESFAKRLHSDLVAPVLPALPPVEPGKPVIPRKSKRGAK